MYRPWLSVRGERIASNSYVRRTEEVASSQEPTREREVVVVAGGAGGRVEMQP